MARRKLLRVPVAVVSVLLALTLTAGAALAGTTTLVAFLTGEAEAPGPGDPNGFGFAEIKIRAPQGTLCYDISVSRIRLPAIGAHIHQAPEGEPGPVVVTLGNPAPTSDRDGRAVGCVSGLASGLLRNIANHPEDYYVNVHTRDYPGGAIRGQLVLDET